MVSARTARLAIFSLILMTAVSHGKQCRKNPGIYYFNLGDIRGTVLSDGPIIFEQSPFLAPEADVLSSYRACFLPTSPLSLGLNVVVLDTPHGRFIVDPGARGSQNIPLLAEAGLLFSNLRAAGINPASVDAVLLTHAHADHVNGLITASGRRAFPRAKVYISREDHEFWTADPLAIPPDNPVPDTLLGFAQTYQSSIAPYRSRLVLVESGGSPLPGIEFVLTPGHSPGHSSITVSSKGQRLIISGDTWFSKPDQVQNPGWGIGTDIEVSAAVASRRGLLNQVAKERDLVLAYHEQFPGLGYVRKDGESFKWVAAPQQIGSGVRSICRGGRA